MAGLETFGLKNKNNNTQFNNIKIYNMSFKGVIFDLDGTLVDSVEDIADSMNIVLTTARFSDTRNSSV